MDKSQQIAFMAILLLLILIIIVAVCWAYWYRTPERECAAELAHRQLRHVHNLDPSMRCDKDKPASWKDMSREFEEKVPST